MIRHCYRCCCISLLALALLPAVAGAEVLQLAELVVGPDKTSAPKVSNSRNQRERAGAYQQEAPVNSEEEDFGILSPRGGSPAEERAYESRTRAKNYQPGGNVPPGSVGSGVMIGGTEIIEGGATSNRNRAKAYTGSGNFGEIDLSHVGRDGIPIVPCQEVDNVSGRIGDDSSSGALVMIIRQGKQVKVRCR